MRNLSKKRRELPREYSVILGVSLALLTTSIFYPVAVDMYKSKAHGIERKMNEELKIELNQRSKDLEELEEIKKGFEDFQDNYYRGFKDNPYLEIVPRKREVERVRYI